MKGALISITVIVLTDAAVAADAPKAHEPARPVEASSFWAGRWYEIGRTPKSFNKDCMAA